MQCNNMGFGTYKLYDKTFDMVTEALSYGYKYIDTASLYKNEDQVGRAIKDSNVAREDVFIITKIHVRDIKKGNIRAATTSALNKLGTYIDLLLLHNVTNNYIWAWHEIQRVCDGTNVKKVGVSNFDILQLEQLEPKPEYNQIEISPFFNRKDLVNYCRENNITIISHSIMAQGNKLADPKLVEVAKKNDMTPAQILVNWTVAQGFITLISTSNKNHLIDDLIIKPGMELSELDDIDMDFKEYHY